MIPSTSRASAWLRFCAAPCLALCMQACFGTGVSVAEGTQTIELRGALVVVDTTVAPPAPAVGSMPWRNNSAHELRVTHIEVEDSAKTTFDAPECPTFPSLVAGEACRVRVTAHHDATPGTYPVTVAYSVAGTKETASFVLTIAPGALRINDGATVTLDARSSAVPITVTNDGFDLKALNLDVKCPSPGAQGSTCALDPNDCDGGLGANAKCTARLITTEPVIGQLGAVTAGGASTGAVSCSVAISVGSLSIKNLAVASPGVHNLTLTNLGGAPLSVTDVAVLAPSQTGIGVVGAAKLFAGCQNFTGICTVPITFSRNAGLSDNVGVISVSYTDGLANHKATGVVTLNTATQVLVYPKVTLDASPADRIVAAKNLGPWVWHNAGLKIDPPMVGVSMFSDCATELDVGEEYTATARTAANTLEGDAAMLKALGSNLDSAASAHIAIARGIVVTGTDGSGTGLLLSSTDEGATWRRQQPATAQTTWLGSLLTGPVWVAVGSQSAAPIAAISFSRGAFWQRATLPPGLAGTLEAVVMQGSVLTAFGADGAGHPLTLQSSDNGLTWTSLASQPGLPASGEWLDAAASATTLVAVGHANTDTLIASSTDGGASWAVAPAAPGYLAAVAWDGRSFVAVGEVGGSPLILSAADGAATTGAWITRSAALTGTESLADIASVQGTWLAVGNKSAFQRTLVASSDASIPAFAASRTIGSGGYAGIAAHGAAWLAVGFDPTSTDAILDLITDGITVATQPLLSGAVVTGISSR